MTAAGSNLTAQYRVLGTRVDAVQIPGVIAQIQDWIARRDSCRYVGAPAEKYTPTLKISKKAQEDAGRFLRARRIPQDAVVIGFHSGARIPIRRWGDERFTEVALGLLRQENLPIVWFSEPGSISNSPSHDRCHSATLDFDSFVAVLSRCQFLVCNDSGPMHLANLLAVPVVAIFGSTNHVWFGPRGPNDRVVIRQEMWCRPCFDYCIFDQPYCLRAIEPQDVLDAATHLLSYIEQESV